MGKKKKKNSLKNDYLHEVNSHDFKFKEPYIKDTNSSKEETKDDINRIESSVEDTEPVIDPSVNNIESSLNNIEDTEPVIDPSVNNIESSLNNIERLETLEKMDSLLEGFKTSLDELEHSLNSYDTNEIETNEISNKIKVLFTYITGLKNVNLNNWIKHHLNIGFNHIYILNNGCKIEKINYIDHEKYITIINSDKPIILNNVMEQSYNFSLKYNFDWMMYLRHNEFLYMERNLNIFLSDKEEYDQILLSNRSLVNINLNIKYNKFPNNYSNYYYTFSDTSNTFINNNLKNYVSLS